ncbi:MAG: DUF721 domain-containing protein [Bacteroidales bacterium]|nr:DUF721 domain-containing protein [Candidatus Cryptobacteroides onthequi]MCQ2163710.1 DUF721 domain-containing protein [Bacteroidales bacterium]
MEIIESGLGRKKALDMSQVIEMYIKSMNLSAGLNTRRIFEAWDQASGAARYTIRRYFRDGKLYVTLNSSMVRNQLSFQKEPLMAAVNQILENDELFIKDDPKVRFVEEIILK